jgi:hypothetical protein
VCSSDLQILKGIGVELRDVRRARASTAISAPTAAERHLATPRGKTGAARSEKCGPPEELGIKPSERPVIDENLGYRASVPDLMGFAEVAEAIGVSGTNLPCIKDLPEPVARVKATRIWLAADIWEFAKRYQARTNGRGGTRRG